MGMGHIEKYPYNLLVKAGRMQLSEPRALLYKLSLFECSQLCTVKILTPLDTSVL